ETERHNEAPACRLRQGKKGVLDVNLLATGARQIVTPVQPGASLAGKDSSPAVCTASSASTSSDGTERGGREPSICGRRSSSQSGSMSLEPSASAFSSAVKPGASVAISKRMPPGSRK